jgi:N-acetylmuramoyl-L-alanine amidase
MKPIGGNLVLAFCLAVSAAKGAPSSTVAGCNAGTFHTILDVGHTPEEPGATSARGMVEYDFNLRLAKRIERAMRERGFDKTTLLVTRGKAQPALAERVNKANAARADLFISIHHDSVPEAMLATWEFLGAEGKHNDRFKGHSIFVSIDHPQYVRSLSFARTLGLALIERGLAYTPHYIEKFMGARRRQLVDREAGVYRFDKLAVLIGTKMPAVLLEAGSIINRDEELAMESPERQAQIAAAVTEAVEKFCVAVKPKRKSN